MALLCLKIAYLLPLSWSKSCDHHMSEYFIKNKQFSIFSQKQAKGRLKARHRFQLHFLPLVGEDQDVDLSTGE